MLIMFWLFFGIIFLKKAFSDNVTTLRVFFVNEDNNIEATEAMQMAINHINMNPHMALEIHLDHIEEKENTSLIFPDIFCKKYEKAIDNNQPPHLVFDTTKFSPKSHTVKLLTSALSLPTVSASFGQKGDLRNWENLTANQSQYLLQVMPPADVIPEIIRSITQYMKSLNAGILYDSSFVMDHKFKALLRNTITRHVFTPIGTEKLMQSKMRSFLLLDIFNIFVLGEVSSIQYVVDVFCKSHFNKQFVWYAITQFRGNLTFNCPNASMVFIQPKFDFNNLSLSDQNNKNLQEKPVSTLFYYDLAVHSFLAFRNMILAEGFPSNTKYMKCKDYDGSNSPERSVDLRSYFLTVTEPTNFGEYHLQVDPNSSFNGFSCLRFNMDISFVTYNTTEKLGNWATQLGSKLNITNLKIIQNLLPLKILKVSVTVLRPYIIKDSTSPKGYKGYCIDLLNEIALVLKFDYELKENAIETYGVIDEKGEWNGVVHELMDKEIDVSLGPMSATAERESVIEFTVPIADMSGISILVLRPPNQNFLFKFATVFETNVWLYTIAVYLFTSFLLWLIKLCSHYIAAINCNNFQHEQLINNFNFGESLWFCLTSLTPQGGGDLPSNLACRIIAATWFLYCFVLTALYVANLGASLSVSNTYNSPVKNIDDLSKQYKILYSTLKNSVSQRYFERMAYIENKFFTIWKDLSQNQSLSPLERSKFAVWEYPMTNKFSKMWRNIQAAGLLHTWNEGVRRVRNSTPGVGFALIGPKINLNNLTLTNCDLQIVGEDFGRVPLAMGVQRDSPIKDEFNSVILNMLNTRKLERLKEKWFSSSNCGHLDDQKQEGISIHNVGGAYIIICVGIALASTSLLTNFLCNLYGRRKRVVIPNK